MTTNQRNAVRLLGAYTNGRFDIWALTGPAQRFRRAILMAELTGEKIPQSKAGIYALKAAFYNLANPQGDCEAQRQTNFADWCKNLKD